MKSLIHSFSTLREFWGRKQVKSVLVYLFSEVLTKALPFAVFPVIAIYLTVEEFGYVNNYQVLTHILTPFIGLTLSAFYSVEFHRNNYDKGKLVSNIIGVYLLFFTGLFLVVTLFRGWIAERLMLESDWVFASLFSALSTTLYTFYLAHLRISEQAKTFGLMNISNSIIMTVSTVLLVIVWNFGAYGRIVSLVLTSLISGAWSFFKLWQQGFNLKLVEISLIKDLLRFGLPLLPHAIALWLKSGYEKAFITDYIGLEANGYYSFAFNVGVVVTIAATGFFSAFSPWVYKVLNSESNNLRETKKRVVRYTYVFILLITLLISIYGIAVNGLIKAALPKYTPATSYIVFVLLYHFFNILYIIFSSYLYLSKSTSYLAFFTLGGAIIQIILMHALVDSIGIYAVLIATISVSILTFLSVAFYSSRVYPMPWSKPGFFSR